MRRDDYYRYYLKKVDHDFIGWSPGEILRIIFDIEGQDETFQHFTALSGNRDIIQSQICELERKATRSSAEIRQLDQLYRTLYYVRKVKVSITTSLARRRSATG